MERNLKGERERERERERETEREVPQANFWVLLGCLVSKTSRGEEEISFAEGVRRQFFFFFCK
jgi:hypothetical protein